MSEITINNNKSHETDKYSRIVAEYERLSSLFEELSEEEFAVLYPTIKQAAFMRITLEDLSELIISEGPVEAYQNGANQMGMKQSAALQSYNSTIKNYAATIKMLFDKLPRKPTRYAVPPMKTPEELAREREERQQEYDYWANEAEKLLRGGDCK